MITLVVVNYNGLNDTLECVESILRVEGAYRVIVVDNGSNPSNDQAIRGVFPNITVIRSEENLGWSGGNNLGAREAIRLGSDWIFLLNNDVVLRDNWYSCISSVLASDSWDVFGPIILDYLPPHAVQTEGVNFNRRGKPIFERIRVGVSQSSGETRTDELKECDIVNGCAMIIRSRIFDQLGGIDDRFFLIAEESDFCLRARKMQARIGVMHDALVLHKHSVSFKRAGRPLQLYYDTRNLGLLIRKHPSGTGCNGTLRTWYSYLKAVHYAYSKEIEYSNPPGARAVAEGFADFLLGRFGRKSLPNSYVTAMIEGILMLTSQISRFV
jgi:GT2 family glycosyltransferase